MAKNSSIANSHLRSVRSTLSNITNPSNIADILSKTALDLFSALEENKIDVDKDLKNVISNLSEKLKVSGNSWKNDLEKEIESQMKRIDAQIKSLWTVKGNNQAIASLINEKEILSRLLWSNITDRSKEIEKLYEYIAVFNTNGKINEDTVDISRSPVVLGWVKWPQDLKTIFFSATLPAIPSYNFSNEDGEHLAWNDTSWYKVSIWWVEYTIKWLSITSANLSIDQNNFSITPKPEYPFELNIYVSASFDDVNIWWESIVIKETKPLKLTLNNGAPLVKMDSATERRKQINEYNNAGVNPGAITRSLDAKYRNEWLKLQKEAVFDALKKLDGPKFDKLNDAQKDEFFNTIYARYSDPRHPQHPSVTFWRATTPWWTYIQNINNYDKMRDWMSADDHESNTPEHTKSAEAYRNYVHNNLEDQTGKYITAQLDRLFSDDLETNMYLKSELSDFLTGLENRKRDDNTHAQIDAGLQEDAMENARWGAGIFSRLLGRRDVNYGRFFAGKASKKIDATVALDTERESIERNKKYPNPLTYGLETQSSGDSLKTSITMPGLGELTLKGREPNAIVREILRRQDIPFGKLRCHIAYSFLKSMVQMAKDSHINLNYTDPAGNKRRMLIDDNNKLCIEQRDDQSNASTAWWWTRIETNHFNEDMFDNNQVRDSRTDNRSLRRGIEWLATEFNCAMNQYHRHYRTATERRRWWLKKGEMRTTLPSNFFLSPIKSIRKWLGAKMDFSFSTSVSGWGKSANIEFTGKQFKVTIGDKTYTNNNLGTILKKREWWKRVFDGIEREICAAVYKQLVDKLRENRRVAGKHFGVVDPMTKGVYMIDTDGEWSYIEPENANQSNIQRSKFMERALWATLGAAAWAVGGAALASSSLFKWSLIGGGAGALTGWFLWGMDSRNSYGEIANPPTTRRQLLESERESLYHNPLLMARMIRAMSDWLR